MFTNIIFVKKRQKLYVYGNKTWFINIIPIVVDIWQSMKDGTNHIYLFQIIVSFNKGGLSPSNERLQWILWIEFC